MHVKKKTILKDAIGATVRVDVPKLPARRWINTVAEQLTE